MTRSLAISALGRAARQFGPILVMAALVVVTILGGKMARPMAEEARPIPAPALDEAATTRTSEVVVLAGGCFWGVQGVFQHVKGVVNAVSGYTGGDRRRPNTTWSAKTTLGTPSPFRSPSTRARSR